MAERIPVFWDFNNIKLKQAQRELDRTRVKTRQLQGSANLLSKSFKNLGTTLLATFGAIAVLAAFRNILKSLKDLEFQMSKVAAISGATSKQMIELRNNAIKVGAASKFTATEVGKLQEELARLGFTAKEIVKLTDSIAALAIVADTELGPTALAVAKTINAFSLSAVDAGRVTNVMAESFANSALTLEKFDAAMRNVGPAAVSAGLSLEKTTAIIAVLVDNGIEASKAGTDLRRILIENAKAGLTLEESFDILNRSTTRLLTSFDLFGARALVAGDVLAKNTEQLEILEDQFSDTTREIDRMRRIMEDNLETDLKKLKSQLDAIVQSGSDVNIFFRGFINNIRDYLAIEANLEKTLGNVLEEIETLESVLKVIRLDAEDGFFKSSFAKDAKGIESLEKQLFELRKLAGELSGLSGADGPQPLIITPTEDLLAAVEARRLAAEQAAEDAEAEIRSIKNIKKEISTLNEIRSRSAPEDIGRITQRIELLKGEVEAIEAIGKRLKLDQETIKNRDKTLKQELEEAADIIFENAESIEELNQRLLDNADEGIAKLLEQSDKRKEIRDKELKDKLLKLEAETEITRAVEDLAIGLSNTLKFIGEEDTALAKVLFIFEKAAAIANIIVLGALEKAKIGAQLGVGATPFIIAATIRQAASIATVVATTIAGFKEGVIDYQGKGTATSDSNLVRISKGESIIKASATSKSKELLEAINSERLNDELSEILLNNKISNLGNDDVVNALSGVNKSIKGLPIHQTFFNEEGVSNYILKEHSRIRYIGKKYYHGE